MNVDLATVILRHFNCSVSSLRYYCIVPGKRPWAFAAQAPKFEGGGYTEKLLKWFNYPHARAHPGCEV